MKKKPDNCKNKVRLRTIDPYSMDMAVIREAEQAVRDGGVIIFPTQNLYGLGADAFNSAAAQKVFQIKRRSVKKPLSVLIKSRADLALLVTEIPQVAQKLMDKFWPGKLTIVFKARPDVPSILTAGTGKIGIRVSSHPVAAALTQALDHPITATSANISGREGASRIKDLPNDFLNQAALILDAGILRGGKGSTVVDATTDPPIVLREGEVSRKEIYDI